VNVKVYVVSSRRIAQAEFKHIRTSVAEAETSLPQWSIVIIIDCSSSRSSRAIVKVSLIHQSYQQLLVQKQFRSSTRRYGYCLRSGSVISTSSSSIGECKGIYVVSTAEGLLKLNSNTTGLLLSRKQERSLPQLEHCHYH
jgi:hypothetical protein